VGIRLSFQRVQIFLSIGQLTCDATNADAERKKLSSILRNKGCQDNQASYQLLRASQRFSESKTLQLKDNSFHRRALPERLDLPWVHSCTTQEERRLGLPADAR
jgi:hypothetical protein